MSDARLVAAQRALDAGEVAVAMRDATRVIDDALAPASLRALAFRLRSDARSGTGDTAGALDDAREATVLAPGDARAWHRCGIAAADAGELDLAIACFERATRLDPGYARAWNNLGNALRGAGRHDDGRAAFERAVAADSRYAFGWTNLAVARRDAGDSDGAADAARRAIALDARQASARIVLASIARRGGDLDGAVDGYRRALVDRPGDARARFALAGTLAERDDMEAAHTAYVQAARDDAGLLRARLGAELALPSIMASETAIAEARERFRTGVARLRDELPARASGMPADRVLDEMRWTNFLLAYHGEDDRDLQAAYGDLLAATIGAAREPSRLVAGAEAAARPRDGRRRIAFVSAFLRDGTAGRYFESWITGLARDRFEVIVFHLTHGDDELTARIRARADRFVPIGSRRTADLARTVFACAADAIVYPELGMDATTFVLASLRLAPLQAAGWGHPVTSGLATVDAMFGCDAMEPEGGEAQYRERLVRLPGLGTRYARFHLPEPASRAALGLPEHGPLLLVPQSLFKLHPADDRRIARVLAAAPLARVVAFAGRHPRITAAWRARLDPVLDAHDVARERVIVRPQVGHHDYLRVNLACDAMLDSARWSGGNTSLDAIACGLPIATLPGTVMRARQSAGMLALAGATELVASDEEGCVASAVRLATDRDFREAMSRRVSAGAARVFDDAAPLTALGTFLSEGPGAERR
ncbi:MAG: tetratricopeptide repeat protein [Burkholderiales bacterium]|nr:tetratricopeptide repeat protein [Burkholderiales bacterium]